MRHDALNDLYRKVIYSNSGVYAYYEKHKQTHEAVTCEKCVFKKRNKIITLLPTAVIILSFHSVCRAYESCTFFCNIFDLLMCDVGNIILLKEGEDCLLPQ